MTISEIFDGYVEQYPICDNGLAVLHYFLLSHGTKDKRLDEIRTEYGAMDDRSDASLLTAVLNHMEADDFISIMLGVIQRDLWRKARVKIDNAMPKVIQKSLEAAETADDPRERMAWLQSEGVLAAKGPNQVININTNVAQQLNNATNAMNGTFLERMAHINEIEERVRQNRLLNATSEKESVDFTKIEAGGVEKDYVEAEIVTDKKNG